MICIAKNREFVVVNYLQWMQFSLFDCFIEIVSIHIGNPKQSANKREKCAIVTLFTRKLNALFCFVAALKISY